MTEKGSDMEYLLELPDVVPPGKLLVHNSVRPQPELGRAGFRAWLSPTSAEGFYEVCNCGWASELGKHFRVVRGPYGSG